MIDIVMEDESQKRNKNLVPLKDETDDLHGQMTLPISTDVFTDCVDSSKLPRVKPSPHKSPDYQVVNVNNLLKNDDQKRLKSVLREVKCSIESDWRSCLWLHLCRKLNEEAFCTDAFYDECCNQLFGGIGQPHLPLFVDQDHLHDYFLDDSGRKACTRLLTVLSSNHPAITYSPTLYSVCSIFLHYVHNESNIYSCLEAVVSSQHGKFLSQTKINYDASIMTVSALTKKHAKVSYMFINKLLSSSVSMKSFFKDWLWWIFRDLPFNYLVRVIDCYLCEGNKILYRIAIAMIILFHKHSGKFPSSITTALKEFGVSKAMSLFVSQLPVTQDKLLKVAFKIRNFKSSEVRSLLLENEMIVKSKLARSPSSGSNHSYSLTYPKRAAPSASGELSDLPSSHSVLSFKMSSNTITVKETKIDERSRHHSAGYLILTNFRSSLISHDQLVTIWSWIPPRITTLQPQVVYSTSEHGCSLTSFYMHAEKYEPTILLIRTYNNEVFGAYCSGSWMERHEKDKHGKKKRYFGTGESFLFTLSPKMHKFPWIGIKEPERLNNRNQFFMMSIDSGIAIGGGGSHAIWLDQELNHGRTGHSETFNNPSLVSASHDDFNDLTSTDFTCSIVEVVAFHPT
ncbi:TBC1D24 (predicted) [Pycnogonum litorale]